MKELDYAAMELKLYRKPNVKRLEYSDPGFLQLCNAHRELKRAVKECRTEQFKARLQEAVSRVKKVRDEFSEHVKKERKKALQ